MFDVIVCFKHFVATAIETNNSIFGKYMNIFNSSCNVCTQEMNREKNH